MKCRHVITIMVTIILIILNLSQLEGYEKYNVIIVGAGSGGTAAAIQAARMGAKVAMVEETGWIGGQITACAVSTMDDVRQNRSGIYRDFIDRVRKSYEKSGTNTNICYWGSDTISTEPATAQRILMDMMEEASRGEGSIDLYMHSRVKKVLRNGDTIYGVLIDQDGSEKTLNGNITVDATECGDLLPMTGARYRAGNSISPNLDMNAEIQSITWVAVIRKYSENVPKELAVTIPPEGYRKDLWKFRRVVSRDGNTWPGKAPFDINSHNAYRALPDRNNGNCIEGKKSETWPFISRTCVNWANDFPSYGARQKGLSVRYLEDRYYRQRVNTEALKRTLRFLYYFRNELGMVDWAVDDQQGYGVGKDNVAHKAWFIPDIYDSVLSCFPPLPYVRESRRIVGIDTMTAKSIKRDPSLGRAIVNRKTSIALGEYPMDLHSSRLPETLESDLNEDAGDYPSGWKADEGVFQVPYGVLVPEKIDGLLAAEKNISVSRLVNGATRLQPITLLTGQAVGATAALCSTYNLQPRELPPLLVQDSLLNAGSRLSLYSFRDAPVSCSQWKGIQGATLMGYIPPLSRGLFGNRLPMEKSQIELSIQKAYDRKILIEENTIFLTRAQFSIILKDLGSKWNYRELWTGPLNGFVTKGEVASAIWKDLVLIQKERIRNLPRL